MSGFLLDEYPAGATIPCMFHTFGASQESITLTGLATTDIEVYKGTSMTQRSSDNGFALIDTDGIDIDSRTGIHGISIDTSDNSDSGFYSVGDYFHVVIDAVTVNSQTVRFVLGSFRLRPAESAAGVQKVDATHFGGTAGTFASGRPEVNTTHAAGTAWGSGAITAGAIAGDAITAAKLASDVGTEIATAVWTSGTRVLTAGTNIALAKGTGVTGFNDLSAAQVNAEVDTALADYDAPTKTELDSAVSPLATAAALTTVDSVVDAIKVTTDKLDGLMEDSSGYRFTEKALEEGPAGGGGGGATAEEVWEYATRTLTSAGDGSSLTDIPWNADWDAEVQSEVADALAAYDAAKVSDLPAAAPSAVENADALLARSIAGGANGGRTVGDALKSLRNKTAIEAGTLTVFEADDTTPAWTATVSTTPGDPLSSIDPA